MFVRSVSLRFFAPIFVLGASVFGQAGPSLTLSSSVASPQAVGAPVIWTATLTGGANPLFQFSIQDTTGAWNIIRDYSPINTLPWTTLTEGTYTIAVRAYIKPTVILKSATFTFNPRITGTTPAVFAIAHPMVALYSAPACTGNVKVYFYTPGKPIGLHNTPSKPCQPGKTVNFYIAGMYANTTYYVQQQVINGSTQTLGPVLTFKTGAPAIALPTVTATGTPGPQTSMAEDIVMWASFIPSGPQQPVLATDLYTQPVWYLPIDPSKPAPVLVRPVPGGDILALVPYTTPTGTVIGSQFYREIDLAGNLVRETSIWAMNLQLTTLGRTTGISWFSHEGIRLPNGHTLIFGSEERVLTNVQGTGPVDVLGDNVIDLDSNFQVKWVWSAFDHLDTTRPAVLNEVCVFSYIWCPLHLSTTQANDWTHANSIAYLSSDGNIIVSLRNQDWLVKVDYENGSGTGNVLWRLGNGGDFALNSADPDPGNWFSHQHDIGFDGVNLDLFDNGNTRYVNNGGNQVSRGQVWSFDQTNLIVTPVLNVSMKQFYAAAGAAQKLANGNYMFEGTNLILGNITNPEADMLEVHPDGTSDIGFSLNTTSYRTFRITDMYSYNPTP